VDTEIDRPRWRQTANYRLRPTLQVGLELNPAADEIGPLFNWFLVTETETRPAAFLGTSSDRIGSPAGEQSYYLTLAKYFPALRVGPYMTLNYSEWDERINFPFGLNAELGRGFVVRPMYDGQRTHLMAGWYGGRVGVSLLYIWLEEPGISISTGF
jgi:hypothetical protein